MPSGARIPCLRIWKPVTLLNPRPLYLHVLPRALLAVSLLLGCALPLAAQDWTYRVRPGDTLWDLGSRYLKPNISWQALQAHNRVNNPHQLPPGQTLQFPIAWLRVEPAPARVLAVRGPVRASSASRASYPVTAGMSLGMGSQLQTGTEASVTLEFADNSRLQLRENSQLQLDQLSSYGDTGMVDTRIRLQRGRSSNRVTPARGPASRYMITAPTATSSVRGTVFRVSAGDSRQAPSTEVVEGRVQVGNRAGGQLVETGHATRSISATQAPAKAQALLPAPRLDAAHLRLDSLPLLAAWEAVAGASGYRVEVVQAQAPEVLLFAHDAAVANIQINDLPPGQLRLLVRAVSADGVEGLDAEHDFVVPDGPEPPLTLAPQHGQTVHQPQPRFEWAVVPDAEASIVQIADDALFRQPLIEQQTHSNRLRPKTALAPGNYFWRVASLDAQGQRGRYGQALPLQVSDEPVDPQLQSDAGKRGHITMRWQAGEPGQRYRVQVARRGDFDRPLLDQETTTPEIAIKRPWRGGTLHVRVQAIDDDGYAGAFSPVQQVRLPCRLCYGAAAGALLLLAL